MGKLTKAQLSALKWADGKSSSQSYTASEIGATPAVCGGLVRRRLLESYQQSEQVRGEPREYYKLYRITDAGRSALKANEGGSVVAAPPVKGA